MSSFQGPPGSLIKGEINRKPNSLWGDWLYNGSFSAACGQRALDPDFSVAIFQSAPFGCL